jgi:3-deoxy-7-phosphoheptulonate synthase
MKPQPRTAVEVASRLEDGAASLARPEWAPRSWQNFPTLQQPEYPDGPAVASALAQLASLPPLVTSWEIERLKSELADAAAGRKFLLQGGDCAESFADCHSPRIAAKLKVLLQMSLVMAHGMNRPVTRVGRFAGQYAKPRTDPIETRDGVILPSYRGDLINRAEFTAAARTPDPQLLLRGYERAALTLNFIRALVDGGFADMHHPELWDVPFVHDSPQAHEYEAIRARIVESLRFIETIAGRQIGEIRRVDFYTSHEALHLLYEQALTRQVPRRTGWYNVAAHFPWIGMRTADPLGGHIEYARGIENPVGLKVGPDMPPEVLRELVLLLNPRNEPGRLTLIHRLGAEKIATKLPALIAAVAATGAAVLWCCDPMHGNTKRAPTAGNGKTRGFADIRSELEQAFDIHAKAGTHLGGVHVELTGENVVECNGESHSASHPSQTTGTPTVDPRLNLEQSLELAMLIGRKAR